MLLQLRCLEEILRFDRNNELSILTHVYFLDHLLNEVTSAHKIVLLLILLI